MGELQWIKASTEMIPVPVPSEDIKINFVCLVDRILEILKQNDEASSIKWNNEVDRMVYQLYDLTESEINIIEDF